MTFHRADGSNGKERQADPAEETKHWIFDGYCFSGETQNRNTDPSRLEARIKEARREAHKTGVLHICELGEVIAHRPRSKFPEYYETDIFGKENEPRVYFELLSIKRIDISFLEDYIVSSSEKEVLYDLKKTISSYMFIQHKDAPRKPKVTRQKKAEKKVEIVNKNGCVYRKEGVCTNRRCINYQYECLRPQMCLKQKIK